MESELAESNYAKYGKKWYEANKASELERNKEYYRTTGKAKRLLAYPEKRRVILKSRYGITPEDFDSMYERQGGLCAICNKSYHLTMHIDHNHTTGKVRGLLCNNCNRGLGHFKDSEVFLKNAQLYISGHGGSCGV